MKRKRKSEWRSEACKVDRPVASQLRVIKTEQNPTIRMSEISVLRVRGTAQEGRGGRHSIKRKCYNETGWSSRRRSATESTNNRWH